MTSSSLRCFITAISSRVFDPRFNSTSVVKYGIKEAPVASWVVPLEPLH